MITHPDSCNPDSCVNVADFNHVLYIRIPILFSALGIKSILLLIRYRTDNTEALTSFCPNLSYS